MIDIRDHPLSEVDVRVIGALIEKEITTPDNYPLTLNALVAACNQSSNRDPVMSLDDGIVSKSLDDLARRSLVGAVHRSDSRAKRYRHRLSEALNLHPAETAVMCVLMLRGAQTAGEIRTRTTRLFAFRDLAHVDVTLEALMTLATPLVAQMPRRPGQKEVRYAHLLSGDPVDAPPEIETQTFVIETDRVAALEQSVEALRAELAELRERFDALQREFQ